MRTIGVLAEDIELINHLKSESIFDEVFILSESELLTKSLDVVLVSDRSMSISKLKALSDEVNWSKCFYMITGRNFSNLTQALVESEKITMIPPRLTVDQIVDFVMLRIQRNSITRNKLFTFFGADGKVGTTMLAQSTAERLSKISDRVVYISLDGSLGDDYSQFESKFGLGDIKSKLQTKILSRAELEEICTKCRAGYYVLPGIKSILLRRQFHPEHISYLLTLLKQVFDIVIIDVGANIELGTSVAGLNATPNRFLVTTQQHIAYKRFNNLKKQVLDLMGMDHYMLILNKYVESSSLEDSIRLEDKYCGTLVTTVPHSEYGWQCEQEQRTLIQMKDSQYMASIERICEVITSHLGIPFERSPKRRTGIMKRLFSLKSSKDVTVVESVV